MYYRPQEKKRGALLTFLLYTLLAVMLGMLVLLVGIYVGYFNIETPTLAQQFAPTPTPTRPAVLYVGDGDTYFAQGKLNEAIAAYQQAIEIDPTNDVAYMRQSRLLIFTRNTGRALDQAAQAVALNPNSPENLAHYCRALDWEARYAEAFDVCGCTTELYPSYAEGYAFLSEVYADTGNWGAAQENAKKALDLNFQSMDAHHNMGYALEVQGRYPEAVKFYDNAITLAPNLAPLYIDAGRIYQNSLGDYETAAERFKKAIKLSPFDPEAYDLLGWTYYLNGDYVRAINALEQSLGVDPNYVNPFRKESAWGHLATVYYTRQNFESAIEYFPKAIELAEGELLRRVRQVEIHTETQTLTGSASRPILRGRFSRAADSLNFVAPLQPVNYAAAPAIETEQSCADLIAQSIKGETLLLGPTESLTATQVFSQSSGTATLDPTNGNLFLDLQKLPQPQTTPYEIKVTFWPNRTDSVGFFQPQADGRAQVNIKFEEKSLAPIEYYYQLGLAYAFLDNPQCQEAIPWLLKALEIDSSGYNPAWYGLRPEYCPSPNSPPTPIPTWTPEPTDQPQ
jgi:tetratricopeptide (TPR) repeat protein